MSYLGNLDIYGRHLAAAADGSPLPLNDDSSFYFSLRNAGGDLSSVLKSAKNFPPKEVFCDE